jgi:exosortase E/protease (VPEID-CTERM system)
VAFGAFLVLCLAVRPGGARSPAVVAPLYGSAILSIGLALCVFAPWRSLLALGRGVGSAWLLVAAGALVTGGLAVILVALWDHGGSNPLEVVTFRSVEACVGLLVDGVTADPSTLRIATPGFRVRMQGGCSGVEGLGLMLVFSLAWLWFYRRETRFPRGLLLVPLALLAVWAANVARITVLILIGHAGARSVALGGFHSQAGWIFFNGIALGFAGVASRLPWLARDHGTPREERAWANPTAPYLVPFLAIGAAAIVSRAGSAGFEWLYPLRLVAGLAAVWLFRSTYRRLDWRFGWSAVGAGALVFGLWIGLANVGSSPHGRETAAGLVALPVFARLGWIGVRVLGAVTLVPIAEELAFRGYLARRVMDTRFENVSYGALTLPAIAISSLLFGLLHGGMWLAGAVAGAVYALVARRSGRVGDAVAAHATTNALLGGWVVARGAWDLW